MSGSVTLEILMKNRSTIADIPTAELILITMWFKWWQRGQLGEGEMIQELDRSTVSIKVLATNFIKATTRNHSVLKDIRMWKKPIEVIVKINVEASFRGKHSHTLVERWREIIKGNFISVAT